MDENLNKYWTLRAALYNTFHNWHIILACILLGSMLGWGLSFLWPSYYRASSNIYIGLNPYRKFSDTNFEALANPKFSNLDNYQYWQMSQLNSAILMDSYLEDTLTNLRMTDPYWQSVTLSQLRGMLETEWRSSGTWSLIANHPNALHAQQAAKSWSDVVVERVPLAVAAARNTFMIDQKLQVNEEAILQSKLRQHEVAAAQKKLQEWQKTARNNPPDNLIDLKERWQLLAAITQLADYSPIWMEVLNTQPKADASTQAYLEWIDHMLPILESEAETMQQLINSLNQQQIELATQYSQESQKSLSFSPNIEVQRKEDQLPQKMQLSSTLILVGGITGLIIGLLVQLVMITRSGNRQ
jgi:hypothetical protein